MARQQLGKKCLIFAGCLPCVTQGLEARPFKANFELQNGKQRCEPKQAHQKHFNFRWNSPGAVGPPICRLQSCVFLRSPMFCTRKHLPYNIFSIKNAIQQSIGTTCCNFTSPFSKSKMFLQFCISYKIFTRKAAKGSARCDHASVRLRTYMDQSPRNLTGRSPKRILDGWARVENLLVSIPLRPTENGKEQNKQPATKRTLKPRKAVQERMLYQI